MFDHERLKVYQETPSGYGFAEKEKEKEKENEEREKF
jgi:hypothetical protein